MHAQLASHCSARTPAEHALYRRALAEDDAVDGATFLRDAKYWLVLSLLGAAVTGVCFLALFRSFARVTVWGIVYLKVATLAAVSLLAATAGGPAAGVPVMVLALLSAFVFWLWREEIDLVARLLAVASKALQDNPHLITATVFLKTLLLCFLVPLAAFVTAAYTNGGVEVNPEAVMSRGGAGAADTCTTEAGEPTACCVWRVKTWAGAYIALASLAGLWTVTLAFEARMFTIAGAVAQWYFAVPGTTDYKGTTIGALRHAFGPSFGSLCFGSLVIAAVSVAREMNRSAGRDARRSAGGGAALLVCLLSSCLDCLYALVEYISKFATIQCAITGAAFCDAARSVSRLLADNFLSAYGVWWLPGTILGAASFVLSAAYGALVGLSSYATWTSAPRGEHPAAGTNAVVLGVIAFVLALVILQFCVSVLLNVVDAVFVCYAMDLDRQLSSKPEVHDVLTAVHQKRARAVGGGSRGGSLRAGGAVVQAPDGQLLYGRYAAPPTIEEEA